MQTDKEEKIKRDRKWRKGQDKGKKNFDIG